MVIANKADLLGADDDPEEVRLARAKLARLEVFVRDEWITMIGCSTLYRPPESMARICAAYCTNYGHTLKKHDHHLGQHPGSLIYPL